jgi:hypothetical protein
MPIHTKARAILTSPPLACCVERLIDIRDGEMPDPANDELEVPCRAGIRFEAEDAMDLADRNYRQALKRLKPGDKENFNALHYRLGRVAEALGRSEEAEPLIFFNREPKPSGAFYHDHLARVRLSDGGDYLRLFVRRQPHFQRDRR